MLYLDILKSKEATNTDKCQQDIIATALCMNRIMKDPKGCGQLKSNDTYFPDSWFSVVKTAEVAMAEGVYYYGSVYTS